MISCQQRPSLRVLHAPICALYQPSLIVRGLREHGVHTDLMYSDRQSLGYSLEIPDAIILNEQSINSTSNMDFFLYALDNYDIFHFHSGYTLLPWNYFGADLRLLKKVGKTVFMSRWGCRDGRIPSDFLKERGLCRVCPIYGTSCTDEIIGRRLLTEEKYVDAFINHEFDFGGTKRTAFFLHGSIDLEFWSPDLEIPEKFRYPPRTGSEIRILHTVGGSNRGDVKGTEAIDHAIENLRQSGLEIEYRVLSGISFQDLRFHILQTDVVIDQLRYGSFGSFARESLALGKPVVGHVMEFQRQHLQGLPIIEATVSTVEAVISELVRQPERIWELGRQGREYAKKHFDYRGITQRLKDLYEEVHGKKRNCQLGR